MTNFFYKPPESKELPIIVSSPHSGMNIPDEIGCLMTDEAKQSPDTDLFVDELYGFAPKLGCHFIHAKYSRYVVDLNRAPDSEPLYSDGRQTTNLVPVRQFSGDNIYIDAAPTPSDIATRIELFYRPYHEMLRQLIGELRKKYEHVLLYDCHSINRQVPTIQKKKFPDMILGNLDQTTSNQKLFHKAQTSLARYGHKVADNQPFKGGYITRHYGNPQEGVHTLQLEMSKDLYMNEADRTRNPVKAGLISGLLRETLTELSELLVPKG